MRRLAAPRFVRHALAAALAGFALLVGAAAPAQAQSVIRDSEIEETLRVYATPLLEAANLRPADVDIVLLQDSSLNAFVTGGQNIFIHTGLILEADTPLQLKGVIAHEIGHISGGHLARARQAYQASAAPAYISIGLGILAIAAGAPDAGVALIGGSQQFAAANFFRHTKVQESAADQAGLTFLEASGQSGAGLLAFFENFRYQEVVSEQRRNPYFRTHPLSSDRIEALRQRAAASPHFATPDGADDLLRFKRMQAKLRGFLDTPGRTFAVYPPEDQSVEARYARAVAAYRVPDIRRATEETRALTELEPDNPFFHELLGQILFEAGRAEEAVAPHRRAVELRPNDALLQIALARSLVAARQKEGAAEAVALLEAATRIEPDNAFAWRELASAHALLGDEGLARLASAEQTFAIGDYPRAVNFAQRARRELPQGSVSWRRAGDIASIAEAALRDAEGRRRGG